MSGQTSRAHRGDARTYQLRVDLTDTDPPIWRRLELSSDLRLDEVHRVLQGAFGWLDMHLHRFALGPSVWDEDAQLFLCPSDVEEGDDEGVPEQQVRLGEVIADVGDKLLYVYDYGDEWSLELKLEAVLDRVPDSPRARCVDGGRAGPPEDSGGPWGYQQLLDSGELKEEEFDVTEVDERIADELASP